MGDEMPAKNGVTLQAKIPSEAEIRLLKDGAGYSNVEKQIILHAYHHRAWRVSHGGISQVSWEVARMDL